MITFIQSFLRIIGWKLYLLIEWIFEKAFIIKCAKYIYLIKICKVLVFYIIHQTFLDNTVINLNFLPTFFASNYKIYNNAIFLQNYGYLFFLTFWINYFRHVIQELFKIFELLKLFQNFKTWLHKKSMGLKR